MGNCDAIHLGSSIGQRERQVKLHVQAGFPRVILVGMGASAVHHRLVRMPDPLLYVPVWYSLNTIQKKMHVGRGRESAEPGLRAIEQQMLLTTLITCGKPTASSSKAHLCHALCCYI
ncbi:hypothetical protein BDA96_05G126900 [Sorghum bicolor]|uniref:Uncharacterized protein n=1 Tax=Sorghum bicolor TaxID=4558 RepID=A0A921QZS2_SORBI|nr:hypothetical protein BDA96_05G126900 [Sorghum bicolor]